MERKSSLSLILCLIFTACGPAGFHEPLTSVHVQTESTYVPPTPEKSLAGNYEYFQGLSKFNNVSLSIDGTSRRTELRGAFTLNPQDGSAAMKVEFAIEGQINENYTALLRPLDPRNLAQNQLEIGAKLTCLYTDCSDSFVDVYIRHKGVIYHHQVEAQGRKKGVETAHRTEVKPEKRPKSEVEPSKTADSADADTEEYIEEEEEEEEASDTTSNGYYVGTRESDIQEIFLTPVSEETKQTENGSVKENETGKSKNTPVTGNGTGTAPTTPKTSDPAKVPATPAKVPNVVKPLPLPATSRPEPVLPKHDTSVPTMPAINSNYSAQAIGKPDGGRLVNAANIYDYTQKNENVGFQILYPSRNMHFGTNSMLDMLIQLGKFSLKFMNGYVLSVNAISAKYGGGSGHLSHQTGIDADIAYFFNKPELQKKFTPAAVRGQPRAEWMIEEQWKLFKYAVKSTKVDRIFIDTVLKKSLCEFATRNGELKEGGSSSEAFQTLRVLNYWKGHVNHFHLRIRQDCPPKEPRCFQMVPPPNVTNCR